jgi:histidinol-phosphatase
MLETAVAAARDAEAIIRRYYRAGLEVRLKADRSPVTDADVESERAIRARLTDAFPGHAIYGEELGGREPDAEYLWLVDPIDGTKSFVRQYPFFSTQIALMHRGELVLGVSDAPEFGQLACAVRGEGATLDGQAISVSAVERLEDATLSFGNIASLAGDARRWEHAGNLVRRVNRIRGYGDFYHYHLLAKGSIDVVIESDLNILDIAALSVIVEAAGGRMTTLEGGPIGLETRSILATNGHLHEMVIEALRG